MSHQSYIKFVNGLEQHIRKTFRVMLHQSEACDHDVTTKPLQLCEQGIRDFPYEENSEIRLVIPKLNGLRQLYKYSILSWWLEPYTSFELQEILRKKSVQQHFPQISSLLESKEIMMATLFFEIDYALNDIFGNILQPGVYNYRKVEGHKRKFLVPDTAYLIIRKAPKPRSKIRRRGYDDKGSQPQLDVAIARKEFLMDYERTYEQNLLELRRISESLQATNRILSIRLRMLLEGIG